MESLRPEMCERARQWASERADRELSEFGIARLERHLVRCPSCAGFAEQMDRIAVTLRSAPLARLARPVVAAAQPRSRAAVTRRRLLPLSLTGVAMATVAAALVALAPSPRLAPVDRPALLPDNGRSEIDANRLAAAMNNVAPAPAWPGHGATT